MEVFCRQILDFLNRCEAQLGVRLTIKPPQCGLRLTRTDLEKYLNYSNLRWNRNRLAVDQHDLPSFGQLPRLQQYITTRTGGTKFFLVDITMPPLVIMTR